MPTVAELTAAYGNVMLSPRSGPGVCEKCFNLTKGYRRCFACSNTPDRLAAVLPVSYSVGREQLHHVLRAYKRLQGESARRLAIELAAVLWRFLANHEACLARAGGVERFDVVTTVPSSDANRAGAHPLPVIVGALCGATRDRHERLLEPGTGALRSHEFGEERFAPTRQLRSERVLLVDDTWTTGASAQSAAAALMSAGAELVAAVVVGRHLNRDWHQNDLRLRALARPYDWERCALCAASHSALGAHAV